MLHCRHRRTEPLERAEEGLQRLLDLPIRVEDHPAVAVVFEAGGQNFPQFAAARLVEDAALQSGMQHVKFRLRQGPFHSEQEPIVEVTRIVQAVLVEDEGLG